MLATMPRTTPFGSFPAKSIDDLATKDDFVRALIEIAIADRSAEQLFADETLNECLRLILAKTAASTISVELLGLKIGWPRGAIPARCITRLTTTLSCRSCGVRSDVCLATSWRRCSG
jgi:hypothetical protein